MTWERKAAVTAQASSSSGTFPARSTPRSGDPAVRRMRAHFKEHGSLTPARTVACAVARRGVTSSRRNDSTQRMLEAPRHATTSRWASLVTRRVRPAQPDGLCRLSSAPSQSSRGGPCSPGCWTGRALVRRKAGRHAAQSRGRARGRKVSGREPWPDPRSGTVPAPSIIDLNKSWVARTPSLSAGCITTLSALSHLTSRDALAIRPGGSCG